MGKTKETREAKEEYRAWCPDCSDSLETITIYRTDKRFGKIISHWEYYCFGCDKTFILQEKDKKGGE